MMKKFFALSVAAVFFCMFSVRGQELPDQGANEPGSGEGTENLQSADELYPYTARLRTNIDRKDYEVSLKRTEKITEMMEKALLPGKKEREKYIAESIKGLEEKYRSKDKSTTDGQFIDELVKATLDTLDEKTKTYQQKLEEKISSPKNGILGGASASPAGKPLEATRAKAREYAKELVEKEYAGLDKSIAAKLIQEAKKKYPLYKKGQKVENITYSNGRNHYRISGTFYGYGIGGRSIMINSRTIPKRNLSAEVRARFDEKENERLCQRYVDNGMKEHRAKKFRAIISLTNKRLKEQVEKNDKAGFIFYGVKDERKIAEQVEKSKRNKEKFDFAALTPETQLKFYINKWVSASTVIKDLSGSMISVTRQRIAYELKNAATKEIAGIAQKMAKEKEQQNNADNQNAEENADNEDNALPQ